MNQQLWFEVQAMRKAWIDLDMDRFLSKHQSAKEGAMRVQRKDKQGPFPPYTVLEESPQYYVVANDSFGVCAVHKVDYEPVQEWVDVTHECHISEVGGHSLLIMHNEYQVGTAAAAACSSRYRLKATGSHGIRVERRKA